MNGGVFSFTVVLLILIMSHSAFGKSNDPKAERQVPDGWIVVEEDIWLAFPDEPGSQFHQAHENFLKRDYKATAANIRKAVGFMKLEAARAAGDECRLVGTTGRRVAPPRLQRGCVCGPPTSGLYGASDTVLRRRCDPT